MHCIAIQCTAMQCKVAASLFVWYFWQLCYNKKVIFIFFPFYFIEIWFFGFRCAHVRYRARVSIMNDDDSGNGGFPNVGWWYNFYANFFLPIYQLIFCAYNVFTMRKRHRLHRREKVKKRMMLMMNNKLLNWEQYSHYFEFSLQISFSLNAVPFWNLSV